MAGFWGGAKLDSLPPVPDEPEAGAPPHLSEQDLLFLEMERYVNASDSEAIGGDVAPGELASVAGYASGAPGGYNIEIDFTGCWTAGLQQAFIESAELISSLIQSDIADVFYDGETIDDIHIAAELIAIDGKDSTLGQAGPTAIRTDGHLPATGIMRFDSADAVTYRELGLWNDIVLHEMLHTIGSGTIWDYKELISGAGSDTPLFTGERATLTYEALFDARGAAGVPVEQHGGPGTRDAHWDEEIFGAEIMTGYINWSDNYLLPMTVASLEDLGYDTVWAANDYLIT